MSVSPVSPEQKQHFLALYHMALTDMGVDEKELTLLYLIGSERGITPTEIDQVLTKPPPNTDYRSLSTSDKAGYLYDLVRMAWADGKMLPEEEQLLMRFCYRFGFAEENVPEMLRFFVQQCENGVSAGEIKRIVEENM